MSTPRSASQLERLPSQVADTLKTLMARSQQLKKVYGDLRKAGRPLFESLDEAALTFYAVRRLELDVTALARILDVEVNSAWRMVKRMEEGKVSYYDAVEGVTRVVSTTPEELLARAEELLRPKKSKEIERVTDAECVQQFLKNPVKIQKASKHGRYYASIQVKDTLRHLSLVSKLVESNPELVRSMGVEPVANPDLWDERYEDVIVSLVRKYCSERYTSEVDAMNCKARVLGAIKRIPKFRTWFKGEIGAVRSRMRKLTVTLTLEEYFRLKRELLKTRDGRATWIAMALHILTGAREGIGSLELKADRLKREGINAPTSTDSLDIDDPFVNTSLLGIRWEKVGLNPFSMVIYEEKTKKEWHLLRNWLDPDITKELQALYDYARERGIRNVMKTVLTYYGIFNGKVTVSKAYEWYRRAVREAGRILGKTLTPHRLRSAHITMLAELGIPLEFAVKDFGLGCGWDDLSTAVEFYLVVTGRMLDQYLKRSEEVIARYLSES